MYSRSSGQSSPCTVRIAVVGCTHGALTPLYEAVEETARNTGKSIDLLLCCGDFQAVRNEEDLECLSCPAKYRHMCDFYQYYSGEKEASVPTIFIGGNHEASNFMQELYYGGWVAPNIYYLGAAGVVRFAGLRIGGVSGIYKSYDHRMGYYEFPPYTPSTMTSIYHTRSFEYHRLLQLANPLDIFISHDWPQSVVKFGDVEQLLRRKPFFREDIQRTGLGSPAHDHLIPHLTPKFWFSGHLHTKYAALVPHSTSGRELPAESALFMKFLALDKCLPGRHYFQVVDVPLPTSAQQQPFALAYDPEWLAVVRRTNPEIPLGRLPYHCPQDVPVVDEEEVEEVERLLRDSHHCPVVKDTYPMPTWEVKDHFPPPVSTPAAHDATHAASGSPKRQRIGGPEEVNAAPPSTMSPSSEPEQSAPSSVGPSSLKDKEAQTEEKENSEGKAPGDQDESNDGEECSVMSLAGKPSEGTPPAAYLIPTIVHRTATPFLPPLPLRESLAKAKCHYSVRPHAAAPSARGHPATDALLAALELEHRITVPFQRQPTQNDDEQSNGCEQVNRERMDQDAQTRLGSGNSALCIFMKEASTAAWRGVVLDAT